MLNNDRVSRFRVLRQTLVMPVVLIVTVLVSCSKDQSQAADPKTSPGLQLKILSLKLDKTDLLKLKKAQDDKQVRVILGYIDKDGQKREKPFTLAVIKPDGHPSVEEKLKAEKTLDEAKLMGRVIEDQ